MIKRRISRKTLNESIESIIGVSAPTAPDMSTDEDGKKIQKTLNKLISEEIVAKDIYIGAIMAASGEEGRKFQGLFAHIAKDELEDHAKNLICWAKANGFSVPFKYADYQKFSNGDLCRILAKIKPDQNALQYVDMAIKSEHLAIQSYEDELRNSAVPYELRTILYKNLTDEKEHLDQLMTLQTTLNAEATLYLF